MSEYINPAETQWIDELHGKITAPGIRALGLCEVWKIAKPFWNQLIALVATIPVLGPYLVMALTLFGKAVDGCCPEAKGVEATAEQSDDLRALDGAIASLLSTGSGKPCCNYWDKMKLVWPKVVAIAKRFNQKLGEILEHLGDSLSAFCE